MKNMQFSVLISVYSKERADYLALSLKSITSDQTLMPYEIILVKDGPLTPELDSVCEKYVNLYPDILKIVALPENVGLGNALNEGLKHCSNDLVARMDSDDISKPNRFARQIEVFGNNPDLDIVSAWIEEFEFEFDSANAVSVKKLPEDHFSIFKYAKKRCPINHPVVMFKKSEVILAGGYLDMHLYEDYYLWVRMLMGGSKFYNIQESLLSFRFSTETIKRRGGIKYANTEIKFFRELRRVGLINYTEYLKAIFIRVVARVIPNSFRVLLYQKILRR